MVASETRTDAAERYRVYLVGRGVADATVKNCLHARKQWVSWCSEMGIEVERATAADVSAWWEVQKATSRQGTSRLAMICLRKFYHWLIEENLGMADPTAKIHLAKQISRPGEPFLPAELKRLYAVANSPLDRALLLLLVGTGLRDSEVRKLKEHHINWADGTILILGKGAKYRTVAPGPAAMAAMAEYFKEPQLWGVGDVTHDWLSRWLRRMATNAGITGRVHLHRMRYTFAVEFCESGRGIDLLQTLLGHSNIEMSIYYSKKGRERRALEAMRSFGLAERLAAG